MNNLDDRSSHYINLHRAAQDGDLRATMECLGMADVDVNSRDPVFNQTPLHKAAQGAHLSVVQALVQFRATNTANGDGAAGQAMSAEVDCTDDNRATPLHLAAMAGHIEVVKFLLQHGANPSHEAKFSTTPLHWGAKENHLSVVTALVEAGAAPDVADCYGSTPLFWACHGGSTDVTKYLLGQGADPGVTNAQGKTPLSIAAQMGSVGVVEHLLRAGAKLDSPEFESPPLVLSARYAREDVLRLLLQQGAEVDAKDADGRTALHHTSIRGDTSIASILVEACADLETHDREGRVPLFCACYHGHPQTIEALLEAGARSSLLSMGIDLDSPGDGDQAASSSQGAGKAAAAAVPGGKWTQFASDVPEATREIVQVLLFGGTLRRVGVDMKVVDTIVPATPAAPAPGGTEDISKEEALYGGEETLQLRKRIEELEEDLDGAYGIIEGMTKQVNQAKEAKELFAQRDNKGEFVSDDNKGDICDDGCNSCVVS